MTKQTLLLGALIFAVALFAGCPSDPHGHPHPHPEADAAPAPAEPAPEPSADLEAKLAAADLADGEEDGVVALCAGCGLAMEGSQEHALEVGDYELHFCSDRCQGEFAADPEGSLAALQLPEQDRPTD